jgi:hypothetical protein
MANKVRLSSAQLRTLQEVIEVADKGFVMWSCVPDYKPAITLLKLGYVKKDDHRSDENYRLVLEPTDEGRRAIARK